MSDLSPEVWQSRWMDHVDQLDRARLAMNGEQSERMRELQNEMIEIIQEVADDRFEEQ